MKMRLKDIINLDYLISLDNALDSPEKIESRAANDRKIFSKCKGRSLSNKELLLSWLAFRKKEFFQDSGKQKLPQLPGDVFSSLYTWVMYAAVFTGGVSGVSLAYSFLAYHGTRPINVAVFMVIFVVLQVLFILLTLILLLRKTLQGKHHHFGLQNSIIHTLFSVLFFDKVSKILKQSGNSMIKKSVEKLSYTSTLIQMKNQEYADLFFWPFFMVTSVFAFSFSGGALGGTFFRVIVSDMAFGWQTTLMASSTTVHDIVTAVALPWSWLLPETISHPTLEQIEGSRIILKEGISVLTTQDLVSWWPFICMGILCYAVIPRGILIIIGFQAQKNVLMQFDFSLPKFRQLILRMQSPVLDIESSETPVSQARKGHLSDALSVHPVDKKRIDLQAGPSASNQEIADTVVLSAGSVYSDETLKQVIEKIETHMFLNVRERLHIQFDYQADVRAGVIQKILSCDVDQVVLIHEVWQPPIRGLLYYIEQLKDAIPDNVSLWILLTQEAGAKDLNVGNTDINFKIWEKAVIKLMNPNIVVQRYQWS